MEDFQEKLPIPTVALAVTAAHSEFQPWNGNHHCSRHMGGCLQLMCRGLGAPSSFLSLTPLPSQTTIHDFLPLVGAPGSLGPRREDARYLWGREVHGRGPSRGDPGERGSSFQASGRDTGQSEGVKETRGGQGPLCPSFHILLHHSLQSGNHGISMLNSYAYILFSKGTRERSQIELLGGWRRNKRCVIVGG